MTCNLLTILWPPHSEISTLCCHLGSPSICLHVALNDEWAISGGFRDGNKENNSWNTIQSTCIFCQLFSDIGTGIFVCRINVIFPWRALMTISCGWCKKDLTWCSCYFFRRNEVVQETNFSWNCKFTLFALALCVDFFGRFSKESSLWRVSGSYFELSLVLLDALNVLPCYHKIAQSFLWCLRHQLPSNN